MEFLLNRQVKRRNEAIRRYVDSIRAGSATSAVVRELVQLNAREAVPELLDILQERARHVRGPLDDIEMPLRALSEIGCPEHGGELLSGMMADALYEWQQFDDSLASFNLPDRHELLSDRIPTRQEMEALIAKGYLNGPRKFWLDRAVYLAAATHRGVDDFEALLRRLFASSQNIDGYLVTCLRILTWSLGVPQRILGLAVDFNTIYRRPPTVLDRPIDHAFRALCKHRCPASSNVLRLIQQKGDVEVRFYASFAVVAKQRFEFGRWRAAATAELRARANPPNDPAGYLAPCGCDVEYRADVPADSIGSSDWWDW